MVDGEEEEYTYGRRAAVERSVTGVGMSLELAVHDIPRAKGLPRDESLASHHTHDESESEQDDESEAIWRAWAAGAQAWKQYQDAWEEYLMRIETRIEEEKQQRERESGAHWLYDLYMAELTLTNQSPVVVPWEALSEHLRQRYRRLWDKIDAGFQARLR